MTAEPRPRRIRWLRALLSTLVLLACGWFVRRLPLRALGGVLAGASPPWVVAAVALNLAQLVFRALILRLLLAPVARVTVARLYVYNLATFAANNLFPGRAGEAVRVLLLGRREGVPPATAMALSLVEKSFEGVALLALVAPLPLLQPRALPRPVVVAIALLGLAGAAALVGMWAVARFVRVDAATRWRTLLSRAAVVAQVVRQPRVAVPVLLLALAGWVADCAMMWLILRALSIEAPWTAPPLTLLLLNLAIALPSTPAQLGPFEAAVVGGLGLSGVPVTAALAFALLYHGMQVVPVTLLGLPGLRMLRDPPSPTAGGPDPQPDPQPGAA